MAYIICLIIGALAGMFLMCLASSKKSNECEKIYNQLMGIEKELANTQAERDFWKRAAIQLKADLSEEKIKLFKGANNMLNINEFVKEVGENAVKHGWWEEERSFGELIALCHSELSEALEEYRKGRKPKDTYYTGFERKPEGIPSELADVVIRVFDMCHHYGIEIESMLIEKHEFNKSRPYKHGGKVI